MRRRKVATSSNERSTSPPQVAIALHLLKLEVHSSLQKMLSRLETVDRGVPRSARHPTETALQGFEVLPATRAAFSGYETAIGQA